MKKIITELDVEVNAKRVDDLQEGDKFADWKFNPQYEYARGKAEGILLAGGKFTRVERCEDGYRFPSDEEWEHRNYGLPVGTQYKAYSKWFCDTEYFGTALRHRYRIPIVLEHPPIPEGFRLATEEDRGKEFLAYQYWQDDLLVWKEGANGIPLWGDNLIYIVKDKPVSWEGEVGKAGDVYVVDIKDGFGLKPGQRVRVEVLE